MAGAIRLGRPIARATRLGVLIVIEIHSSYLSKNRINWERSYNNFYHLRQLIFQDVREENCILELRMIKSRISNLTYITLRHKTSKIIISIFIYQCKINNNNNNNKTYFKYTA